MVAFSHRFPDAVPALDTAGLVALISAPQKAAEYWARYEQARKDYDAYLAAAKAARDDIAASYANLDKVTEELEKAKVGFAAEVAEHDAEWKQKKALLRAAEADLAAKAAQVENNAANNAATEKWLEEKTGAYRATVATEEARLTEVAMKQNAKAQELADREAAVAEREAKAEKLAALLKGV